MLTIKEMQDKLQDYSCGRRRRGVERHVTVGQIGDDRWRQVRPGVLHVLLRDDPTCGGHGLQRGDQNQDKANSGPS